MVSFCFSNSFQELHVSFSHLLLVLSLCFQYIPSDRPVIQFSGFSGQVTDVQMWDYPLSYQEVFAFMNFPIFRYVDVWIPFNSVQIEVAEVQKWRINDLESSLDDCFTDRPVLFVLSSSAQLDPSSHGPTPATPSEGACWWGTPTRFKPRSRSGENGERRGCFPVCCRLKGPANSSFNENLDFQLEWWMNSNMADCSGGCVNYVIVSIRCFFFSFDFSSD